MSNIIYTDYYQPINHMSVEETILLSCSENLPISLHEKKKFAEEFSKNSGLKKISLLKEEDEIEIFSAMLDSMFNNIEILQEDIKYIFFTNPLDVYTKDRVKISHYIQENFTFKNCSVITLDQQCATSIIALELARKLLKDESERDSILILSSCFVKDDRERFIHFSSVGDAAGIMLVSNLKVDSGFKLISYQGATNSTYSDLTYKEKKVPNLDDRIIYIKDGVNMITKLLTKNNILSKDIKLVVAQNINQSIYHLYSSFLGWNKNKFFLDNIPNGGHLGDVDIIRNLTDLKRNSLLKKKEKSILYGVGSDGTDVNYSAMLIEYF